MRKTIFIENYSSLQKMFFLVKTLFFSTKNVFSCKNIILLYKKCFFFRIFLIKKMVLGFSFNSKIVKPSDKISSFDLWTKNFYLKSHGGVNTIILRNGVLKNHSLIVENGQISGFKYYFTDNYVVDFSADKYFIKNENPDRKFHLWNVFDLSERYPINSYVEYKRTTDGQLYLHAKRQHGYFPIPEIILELYNKGEIFNATIHYENNYFIHIADIGNCSVVGIDVREIFKFDLRDTGPDIDE